jgi:hypothetical protein
LCAYTVVTPEAFGDSSVVDFDAWFESATLLSGPEFAFGRAGQTIKTRKSSTARATAAST